MIDGGLNLNAFCFILLCGYIATLVFVFYMSQLMEARKNNEMKFPEVTREPPPMPPVVQVGLDVVSWQKHHKWGSGHQPVRTGDLSRPTPVKPPKAE